MTREERLKWLKQIEKDIHVCSLESTLADDMKSCAIHSTIEELEQEPVLDKIRAEIANLDDVDYDYEGYYKAVTDVLQIIDKYKAEMESEDKE